MKWTATLFVVAALALSSAWLGCGCEPKPSASRAGDVARVRVRLLAGVDRCTLTADVPPAVAAGDDDAGESFAAAGGAVTVTFDGRRWTVGDRTVAGPTLRVRPGPTGTMAVNGLPYRGAFVCVAADGGRFDVINDVDVEAYLQGVLPKELLADWRDEAYKAQAVIARTYALYEARTNPPGRAWDLHPDERSQVYGGVRAETLKGNAAVKQTRGVVVAYGPPGQERIFKAYFSACCGGITSSADDVFSDPAIPPLAARYNGTTCAISPRFTWPTVTLGKAELARRLRVWGQRQGRPEATLPGIGSITVAAANAYGRPRTYLLTDTRGQAYTLTAEQLRFAINTDAGGGPTVYSGFFRPEDAGDNVRFTEGHGFGHGVGACQWCMQARSLAGQTYGQIVLNAYPSAVLVQAY